VGGQVIGDVAQAVGLQCIHIVEKPLIETPARKTERRDEHQRGRAEKGQQQLDGDGESHRC